jgi:hypothetical protein
MMDSDYRAALPALYTDLVMLAITGGLQRTEAEYQALLTRAGFRWTRTLPLGDSLHTSVVEAVPAFDAG